MPEYAFTDAVRGKYYERYRQGANVVLLDPDVALVFRDSRAVNDALGLLVSVADAKAGRQRAGARERQPAKRSARRAPAKRKRRGEA